RIRAHAAAACPASFPPRQGCRRVACGRSGSAPCSCHPEREQGRYSCSCQPSRKRHCQRHHCSKLPNDRAPKQGGVQAFISSNLPGSNRRVPDGADRGVTEVADDGRALGAAHRSPPHFSSHHSTFVSWTPSTVIVTLPPSACGVADTTKVVDIGPTPTEKLAPSKPCSGPEMDLVGPPSSRSYLTLPSLV